MRRNQGHPNISLWNLIEDLTIKPLLLNASQKYGKNYLTKNCFRDGIGPSMRPISVKEESCSMIRNNPLK